MNTLSLLIYLPSVIPNVGILLGFAGFLGILILVFVGTVLYVETDKNHFPKLKPWLIASGVSLLIATLIPDQKTIYMIAASEMGEAVVTTGAGQEVFNELKDTLMYQLQQLQGEVE